MEADLAARAMLGYYGARGDKADRQDGNGGSPMRVTRRAQRRQQPQPSSLASLVMADLKATLPQDFPPESEPHANHAPEPAARPPPASSWPEVQTNGRAMANPGTPWATPMPGLERPVTAPASNGASGAQASTEALADELARQRRRGPGKRGGTEPSGRAAEAPSDRNGDRKRASKRSQRGDAAKMPIAPAQWEYAAGPQEASSGREERRKKAAAAESAAGATAEQRKDGDGTPSYGPWIGKTKVSCCHAVVIMQLSGGTEEWWSFRVIIWDRADP